MLPRPTLKITEIFASVQGEGLRQGEPAIFVRLAGCNLRCPFCDTKYAWKGGQDRTWQSVLKEINALHGGFPVRWVCLTGGEPLLQDISRLIRELKNSGFLIQVETNGTVDRLLPVDWYAVSPKPPEYFFQPRFIKKANEVKLIVSRDVTFDIVRRVRNNFPPLTPVLLQPESNQRRSIIRALELLKKSLHEGLENIKLSAQLHKAFRLR